MYETKYNNLKSTKIIKRKRRQIDAPKKQKKNMKEQKAHKKILKKI